MTLTLASNTMQAMAVVFMTVCVTLKALKIIETVSLLVAVAMGSVLLACSGILAHNVYMALVMFSIHIVSALLVIAVTREWRWRLRRR
jgi:xanthine/uracil permease